MRRTLNIVLILEGLVAVTPYEGGVCRYCGTATRRHRAGCAWNRGRLYLRARSR